jgi:hypothetical protein
MPDGKPDKLSVRERRICDIIENGGKVFTNEYELKKHLTESGWVRCVLEDTFYMYNYHTNKSYPKNNVGNVFSDYFVQEGTVLKRAEVYVFKGNEDSKDYPLWIVDASAYKTFGR